MHDDPGAAGTVIGELVGQGQPARQVQRRLHGLADTGDAFIGAQQLNSEDVTLAAQPGLQGYHDGVQG